MGVAALSIIVHGAGKGAWAGPSIALAARIPSLPFLQSLLALPMALAKNSRYSWHLRGSTSLLPVTKPCYPMSQMRLVRVFQIHLTLDLSFVLHPPVSSQADRWKGRKQNIPDRFREE